VVYTGNRAPVIRALAAGKLITSIVTSTAVADEILADASA
jgi:DNA-binding transcriptional regulator LsrR (DeoR family)